MLAEAVAAINAKQLLQATVQPGPHKRKIETVRSGTAHYIARHDVDRDWEETQSSTTCDVCANSTIKTAKLWSKATRLGSTFVHMDAPIPIEIGRQTHLGWSYIDDDGPVAANIGRDISPSKVRFVETDRGIATSAQSEAVQQSLYSYSQYEGQRSIDLVDRLLGEILALRDGWDGPGALAPSWTAKEVTSYVIGQIAQYLDRAEVEVDSTVGDVSFHWFMDANSRIVSVTVQQTGRVVVVSSSVDGDGTRVVLDRARIERVGRTAVDAGLGKLHESV